MGELKDRTAWPQRFPEKGFHFSVMPVIIAVSEIAFFCNNTSDFEFISVRRAFAPRGMRKRSVLVAHRKGPKKWNAKPFIPSSNAMLVRRRRWRQLKLASAGQHNITPSTVRPGINVAVLCVQLICDKMSALPSVCYLPFKKKVLGDQEEV